jgi:biotin carboxyl carrier protein
LVLSIDGTIRRYTVADIGGETWVRTPQLEVKLVRLPDFVAPGAGLVAGGCTAPMPGKIVQVCVAEGEAVEKGQALVVLEAMKMEQTLRAPHAGTVTELRVSVGEQVDVGQSLLTLD